MNEVNKRYEELKSNKIETSPERKCNLKFPKYKKKIK